MALSASNVFQIQSTAAASNINAGGFNPANPNMLTDGAATSATGNSPVFTSASYNFVAGDVGHWLYIKSGTNWTAGWYQIASVAANAATLSAAIGQGIQVTFNKYGTQTVAGCATTASPTSATWTIDYSQSDTAAFAPTDLVLATTTTLTSVAFPFGNNMVGNLIHIRGGTGFTVGWYEIVSVSTVTATIDRVGGTLASTGGIGNTGGALSLGSSDDAVFELAVSSTTASARYFIKGGSNIVYTIGGTVTISVAGNTLWPIVVEGYASTRGDRPTDATRPTFAVGANQFTTAAVWTLYSISFTGTAAYNITTGGAGSVYFLKSVNSSTTTARTAIGISTSDRAFSCEGVSYRGTGIEVAGVSSAFGCWAHDSSIGFTTGAAISITNCISSSNFTSALTYSAAGVGPYIVCNNTFYGAENKLGIALNLASSFKYMVFLNNIIYGFTTGISFVTTNMSNHDDYNNYFNNTTDIGTAAAWSKGKNDKALDPQFTNVVQRTGATATTTSGNHLVQSGATFQTWGITPGTDYLYIKSGTGTAVGVYGIASVDSETQITTDIAITANATADKVWQITQGNNFSVGTNMKAVGYPGVFPGAQTTGYMDIGSVQRQESTGGSGGSFTFS